MQYYDIAISLGQWCMASEALRRCHLQAESMPFDWSDGILDDICGKGGLKSKVDLICNNFEDYFNLEDFENKGQDADDKTKWWVVNRKTGLQYRHDFPFSKKIEESYPGIKEKYDRRVKRLYDKIETSTRILFVFISTQKAYEETYLYEQMNKLQERFPDKTLHFLFIFHKECGVKEVFRKKMNDCAELIELNVNYTEHDLAEKWLGNYDVIYPLLKDYAYTPISEKNYENILYIKNNATTEKYILKVGENRNIPGLLINIGKKAENNFIYINKNSTFFHSVIHINGSNNTINSGENNSWNNWNIWVNQNNSLCNIGSNVRSVGLLGIYLYEKSKCTIGNDVLFSVGTHLWTDDAHTIYNEKGILNNNPKGIVIGDHCWIAFETVFCKNAQIPNNTIVGMRSVVTKSFVKENTCIAGNPAKVIKNNIHWSALSTNKFDMNQLDVLKKHNFLDKISNIINRIKIG